MHIVWDREDKLTKAKAFHANAVATHKPSHTDGENSDSDSDSKQNVKQNVNSREEMQKVMMARADAGRRWAGATGTK